MKTTEGKAECATIDRILHMAARLFAEHGFDGVGMREIASASGVKLPTVFYHFGSKQELYADAVSATYEAAIQPLSDVVQAQAHPETKLRALIEAIFDLFLNNSAFFLLVQREIIDCELSLRRPSVLRQYRDITSVFAKLAQEAVGHPLESRVIFAMTSTILGYCEMTKVYDYMQGGFDADWYRQHRDYLCRMVNQMVFGSAGDPDANSAVFSVRQ